MLPIAIDMPGGIYAETFTRDDNGQIIRNLIKELPAGERYRIYGIGFIR